MVPGGVLHPNRATKIIIGLGKSARMGAVTSSNTPMPKNAMNKGLSSAQTATLLKLIQARFEKNPVRHPSLVWDKVQARLETHAQKLPILQAMEESGGEPDVVADDAPTGEVVFFDCSAESPLGRRSLCYDPQALKARKENVPKHSALGLAAEMGIEVLTEQQYRQLQKLGDFDTKTSSWIQTPDAIRKLGGALFADRRYGTVFVYHNGAESYYAARGFRGSLRV